MTRHFFTTEEVSAAIYELIDSSSGNSITLTPREVSKKLLASRAGNHLHQTTDRRLSWQIRQALLSIGFQYVNWNEGHNSGKYRLTRSNMDCSDSFLWWVLS